MIKRILYSLHRILGTILSILFVIWFLSGLVMIYHTFPKITDQEKYLHANILPQSETCIDTFLLMIADQEKIEKLKLTSFDNNPYFEIATPDSSYRITASSDMKVITAPSYSQIEGYAQKWCEADITQVDTLTELEQWIPFDRYRKDFPIYKFYFADDNRHQLYISSQTGEALQFTNSDDRFWSWLGPIPHWIYLTSLRQHTQLWIDVIVVLSGLGAIMSLSGLWIGVQSYLQSYKKKKKWNSPYQKPLYKWHHVLGFVFGIFVFTFVFSGMMSLVDIPQWLIKTKKTSVQEQIFSPKPVILENYRLSLQKVLDTYSHQVKSVEWSSIGEKPFYKIVVDDQQLVVDASTDSVRLLELKEQDIRQYIANIHNEPMQVILLDEYDNYYISRKKILPLPVYKVEISDEDNSTYYINPRTAEVKYFNANTKARKWTYQALHSFSVKWLLDKPILWNVVMWCVMLGGTFVSFTGLALSVQYLKRKLKRRKRNSNHS